MRCAGTSCSWRGAQLGFHRLGSGEVPAQPQHCRSVTREQHQSQLLCAAHCAAHEGANTKKSFFSLVSLSVPVSGVTCVCGTCIYIVCACVHTQQVHFFPCTLIGKICICTRYKRTSHQQWCNALRLPCGITTNRILTLS